MGRKKLETIISREHAFRFAFMAVSGLLFVGANAAWNGLGYLNPIAWILEWSSVVLTFLLVYASVRTNPLKNHIFGYALIAVSLLISGISYSYSVAAPQVNSAIYQSINPYYFLVLAIPILLMPFLIWIDFRKIDKSKFFPFLFFLLAAGSIAFLLYMFASISPAFPTDESVFDLYAAHLFMMGKNPYNPALMANAFNYFHFKFQAFDPITPLTTGSYVDSLTYPALSFLVFIPAVLLKVKATLIMLPILVAPIVIVWYRAWSRKQWLRAAYVILPFMALLTYVYQGGSADTDALWASLLMLSYFALPRSKASGLLFGLSLSVKQFPLLVFPFFAFFVYKEYGAKKMLLWTIMAVGAFLAINGYFISLGPGYWISSMAANEFAPLMGIGFGIPQVSFAGVFQLPGIYYTIAMVDLLVVFFLLYTIKYREMKYAIFAFPIIIFLFNYRLFSQYLYYWMLLSLIPMLDSMEKGKSLPAAQKAVNETHTRHSRALYSRAVPAILVVILIGSLAVGYHEGVQKSPGQFEISSVKYAGYNGSGYVDSMVVTIAYHGGNNQSQVLFRIFPEGAVVNGNMLLWMPGNGTMLSPGLTYNITIFPQHEEYSVNPASGFMLVAYYGNIQGSYFVPGSSK